MKRLILMLVKNFWRLPWLYFKLWYYAKNTDKYPEEVKYRHIQKIFQIAVRSGNIDMKLYGKENIPKENGFLFYANHQGMFDIVAIGATCDNPVAAVMKKELYKIAFLRHVASCTKSFPMDRENVRQSLEVIQNVTKEVKKGRNYLIFPEGTRSKNGNQMLEFHGGSFRCAIKSKCPVIPVAFIDSYKVLDQKGNAPVTVQMHYMEPIYYDEYEGMSAGELAELVRGRIEAKVREYSGA